MTTEIELTDEISGALNRLLARADDLEPVMAAIGAALEASARTRFETSRDPDGKRWQPSQRAKKTGGLTLVLTAALKNSIAYRADRDSVAVGVEAGGGPGVYAAIHQFGGQAGRGHRSTIPARPYLGLGRDDETSIIDIVNDALTSSLEAR